MIDSKQYLKKKKKKKSAHVFNISLFKDDRNQINIIKNIIINNFHIKTSILNNILINLNTTEKSFKKINMIQNKNLTSVTKNLVQNINMNSDNRINIL